MWIDLVWLFFMAMAAINGFRKGLVGAAFSFAAFFIGLVVAACVGLANGLITLVFNIPSFITTLGMLFIVRSLTVVLSGGFPPNLPIERMPAQLFVSFIGPEGLFRASFLWFIAIGAAAAFEVSAPHLGHVGQATRGVL